MSDIGPVMPIVPVPLQVLPLLYCTCMYLLVIGSYHCLLPFLQCGSRTIAPGVLYKGGLQRAALLLYLIIQSMQSKSEHIRHGTNS